MKIEDLTNLKEKLQIVRKERTDALEARTDICIQIAELHHNLWIEGIDKGNKIIIGVESHIALKLEKLHHSLVDADKEYKIKEKAWMEACTYYCQQKVEVISA